LEDLLAFGVLGLLLFLGDFEDFALLLTFPDLEIFFLLPLSFVCFFDFPLPVDLLPPLLDPLPVPLLVPLLIPLLVPLLISTRRN
jgi:hypothetical protein